MRIPQSLKPIAALWMKMSHAIGVVMSTIILSILWLVLFGLYAIVLKIVALFGRPPKRETYWNDVSEETSDYQHQF